MFTGLKKVAVEVEKFFSLIYSNKKNISFKKMIEYDKIKKTINTTTFDFFCSLKSSTTFKKKIKKKRFY